MMVCAQCGTRATDDSNFCEVCGNNLREPIGVCRHCGKRNPEDSNFCEGCGKKLGETTASCRHCGKALQEGSKFCQDCGQAVGGSETKIEKIGASTPWGTPFIKTAEIETESVWGTPFVETEEVETETVWGTPIPPPKDSKLISLTFQYSPSINYQEAISLCEKFPTYRVEGEGRETKHSVDLPVTEVDLIEHLYDMTFGWKSAAMRVDGRIITKQFLNTGCLGCYRRYRGASNTDLYCYGDSASDLDFNIWGCKQFDLPLAAAGWVDYGEFDTQERWVFDKKRILADLNDRILENKLCPVLDKDAVLKKLEALPDQVNPKIDNNWGLKTNKQGKPIGIKPVNKNRIFEIIVEGKIQATPTGSFSEFSLDEDTDEENEGLRVEDMPEEKRHVPAEQVQIFSEEWNWFRSVPSTRPHVIKTNLWACIALCPMIFAWFTIGKEHKPHVKVAAFAWLIIYYFAFIK